MVCIPPPNHIKYCDNCMAKHNGGWVLKTNFTEQNKCSCCGKEVGQK